MTTPLEERFWSQVRKTDACWFWQGAKTNSGYGIVSTEPIASSPRRYHLRLAHRVAWILSRGPIPDGLYVCHQCDHKLCVRPDHLFLGTQKENIQDASRKGRTRTGEHSPTAKLTAAQVREIRARAGTMTQRALAKAFGVHLNTIGAIVRRKNWNTLAEHSPSMCSVEELG